MGLVGYIEKSEKSNKEKEEKIIRTTRKIISADNLSQEQKVQIIDLAIATYQFGLDVKGNHRDLNYSSHALYYRLHNLNERYVI
jgi:hypothetical protein